MNLLIWQFREEYDNEEIPVYLSLISEEKDTGKVFHEKQNDLEIPIAEGADWQTDYDESGI